MSSHVRAERVRRDGPVGVARWAVCLAVVLIPALPGRVSAASMQDASALEPLLRGRVEAMRAGLQVRVDGEVLLARRALPAFYEARGFAPAWTATGDRSSIDALLRSVEGARRHGLDPDDYHRPVVDSLAGLVFSGSATASQRADLEMAASDAFLMLGSHLLLGRVDPETIDPEWLANRRSAELHRVLEDAVRSGAIEEGIAALEPRQPRYATLVQAAAELRAVAERGGWPVVEPGPGLEEGATGTRVSALRERLRASADLTAPTGGRAPDVFDASLARAVRRFQERHGLAVDGVVGPATLSALNVPAEERAAQIEVNLERWRWLPDDLGERHIEVNIAGFDVRVVDRGTVVQRHRAVVGREYRQTPMFSGLMTYLVLSPYWHVPPNIAAVDKLPLIKADPGILAAQRLVLLDQSTNLAVDPAIVEWETLTGAELNRRYRLRQDPGPWNALGGVKFMFPNRHNVYLHDTPSRELFQRATRSFSSGCIRVEDPLELAEYLLADQPEWSRDRIERVIAAGVERTVRLARPVPVHLLYWTAWAEDGRVHFRDDIYGRDRTVRMAVLAPPPGT